MTAMARRIVIFAAFVSVLTASAAYPADRAKVTTSGNRVLNGIVLADQYDKVELEVTTASPDGTQSKQKRTLKPNEVRKISYIPPQMDFLGGESLHRQGRYGDALAKFTAALADKKAGTWVQQYALYYKADCLGKLAAEDNKKLGDAIKSFDALIKKYPKSRFLPHAYEGIASAYYGAKQYAKMAQALAKLDPKVFGDQWRIRRQLWDARLLEAKGQFDKAQEMFASLAEQAGKAKDNDLRDEARLSQGTCLLQAKKLKEGEDALFRLGKDAGDVMIRAKAYNALGDSFWARGEFNEAHFSYLRIAVLYFDAPEEHAKALYWAAKCFDKRGDPKRAKEMRAELKRDHKDSPWAKKK